MPTNHRVPDLRPEGIGALDPLAAAAPVGIVRLDATGALVAANARAVALLDLTAVPADRPLAALAAKDEAAAASAVRAALAGTEVAPLDVAPPGRAPATGRLRLRVAPLAAPDPGGPPTVGAAPAGAALTVEDVADLHGALARQRSRVEDLDHRATELEGIRDHFERLMADIWDVIIVIDELGTGIYGSASAERVFGYRPEEWVGRNLLDLIHPDDVALVLDTMMRAAEDPAVAHAPIRFRARHADGSWRHVRTVATVHPDEGGRVLHVVTIHDVTDQVRAETELRASEQRFRTLAGVAPIGFFEVDPDGRVRYGNPRWRAMHGVGADDGLPRLDAVPVHAGDRARYTGAWRAALADGHQLALEYRVGGGATTRWFQAHTAPLRGTDGVVSGHVGVVADVTELRTAFEELRASQRQAARANRAKSEFLSRMSHELRTPLNSILGFAQLLRISPLAGDDAEAVDLILHSGRHLLTLIDEVLDITRIETDRLALALEPVDIGAVVGEAVDALRPEAAERGVTVHHAGELSGLTARADRQRALQVLLNLLGNAIRYNRPDGTVHVAGGPTGDGTVAVEVHDSGWGIGADQLHRVFEPFERLGAETRGIPGTGIGLNLSRALAERMGGSLRVRSTPGSGTTFTLTLPEAGPGTEPASDRGAGTTGAGAWPGREHHLSVLCIEDDPATFGLFADLARERADLRVVDLTTASAGLAVARAEQPDVIVVDAGLRDAPGAELVARLRGDARTRPIPVVAVARAGADAAEVAALRRAGADEVLTRPVTPDQVRAVLAGTPGRAPATGSDAGP